MIQCGMDESRERALREELERKRGLRRGQRRVLRHRARPASADELESEKQRRGRISDREVKIVVNLLREAFSAPRIAEIMNISEDWVYRVAASVRGGLPKVDTCPRCGMNKQHRDARECIRSLLRSNASLYGLSEEYSRLTKENAALKEERANLLKASQCATESLNEATA